MRRIWLVVALAGATLGACGGDDGTGPGPNQPPVFRDGPSALPPGGQLLNLVAGDQVPFSARAIDPDVEDVRYRWEIVRDTGSGYQPAPDAGALTGASSSTPVWSVGTLSAPVRVRCTISDGRDSVSAFVGREFVAGTPLSGLVVDDVTTLDASGSPYVVQGGVEVAAGGRLVLGPGVELQMRPVRVVGTNWEKHALRVVGTLVVEGELGRPVILRGGYLDGHDSGPQQFRGIEVEDPGRAELTHARIFGAESGLRIFSGVASVIQESNFERCLTGIRVEGGDATTLSGCGLEDNSIGLQLNNAGVTLDRCTFRDNSLYGVQVDASSGPAGLLVTRSGFAANLQGHLRLAGNLPMEAEVRGCNLLPQDDGTPAVDLGSACGLYTLEFRGNYWGPVSGPVGISYEFEGRKDCGIGVLQWSDSDCGDADPGACDWSPQPWTW